MKFLSKKQLISLHEALIAEFGGSSGIRDEGLFEAALSTPFQTFDNEPLYPTIQSKAAQLCFGLVKNHAFVDGNKRIGTHAMLIFLELNGIELEYSQKELYEIILEIAASEKNADDLLKWILKHQK